MEKMDINWIIAIFGQSNNRSVNPDCGKVYLVGEKKK